MTFGAPIPLGGQSPGLAPVSGEAALALLTEALREKDDIIQAQYAELTECRRQLGLMREAVEHWKAKVA